MFKSRNKLQSNSVLLLCTLVFTSALAINTTENTCSSQTTKISSIKDNNCSIPLNNLQYPAAREKEFKEKFNYASVDCGSRILSANVGARELSALLVNAKDKYMVNRCDTKDKYVELEFCQEILVETIVLSNYELFSSVFKDLRIYVNHMYPATFKYSWKLIGEFQAQNKKGKQIFEVKNPMLWAKYLRLEFLTHYGDEYYCLLSQIKVFGQTMMEEVIEEQVDKDSKRIHDDDEGVQESFFKNLKKRLSALEESAVFTNNFLKKQRKEIRIFLEKLETQQMKVLVNFLNDEWVQFADDNCNSKFQDFKMQINDYRRAISRKVNKLDQNISHIREEMFYYNLLWQIPLAIFLFYARTFISTLFLHDRHQSAAQNADVVPQLLPMRIGRTISNSSISVQTTPILKKNKKRKRKVHFGARIRSNTS